MKEFHANFTKSYAAPAGRKYQHPTMVRHKGVVLALAMDDQRRIFYAALDMNPAPSDSGAPKSPFDVNNWPASPAELIFPDEIAEVGFGVADQTLLPTYQKGSRTPVDPGTRLDNRDKDFFLSTTARLTADAPFQALSDGRYVYIFRQAIDANHADVVFKRDKDGNLVKDKNDKPVPLVDTTLLVDRFVLVGTKLVPKLEVRFQRSRSKTRPQSRKDSLGAKDLDGNDFFEPTQELKFVGNLTAGRFTVLLLPTQVAEIQRWQIFTQNRHTGLIDSFNVERAVEGLFNTRGSQVYTCVDHPQVFAKQGGTCVEPSLADPSQPCDKNLIPRFSKEGYAESALKFENASDHVALNPGVIIGDQFTQEAWIYPTRSQSTSPQALITGEGADKNSGPAIWLEAQTRLRVGFGDGQNWQEFSSKSILTPEAWNHVAVTFDGAAYRFYVGGNLRDKIDLPSTAKPAAQPIKFFGAAQNSFTGTIDDIRLWNRVRSGRELQADMHQRLTGLEPGLVGYWRFDEAEGDTVYDQTNNGATGTLHGGQWITSDAPVGENPGVNRSSFQIAMRKNDGQIESRSLESGMTALLYYQQANVASGYDGKEKPLKQNARVMLAVATKGTAVDDKNYIAALDFGVSNSGRIAQIPDEARLALINPTAAAPTSINDQLDRLSGLQTEIRLLNDDILRLTKLIARIPPFINILNAALQNPASFTTDITDSDFSYLNANLRALKQADADLKAAQSAKQALDTALANARMTVYDDAGFGGSSLGPFTRGFIGYTYLNEKSFNDRISSIKLDEPLQVVVYEDANRGGDSATFKQSASYVGDGWNDRISSMDVEENSDYATRRTDAANQVAAAQSAFNAAKAAVTKDLNNLQAKAAALQQEKNAKETQRAAAQHELSTIQNGLNNGVSVTMPLVHIDAFGLSISGGLLGFAWTGDAPLLFDSATGTLALYFRGGDDQFFAAYFNTFTERAKYPLNDKDHRETVICVARSTDLDMDKIVLEVSGPEEEATCTVTIAGAGIEETWTKVPRDPEKFARVLNGQAGHYDGKRLIGYREYIGAGTIVVDSGQLVLKVPDGIRRELEADATLMAGETRVTVREAVANHATAIPIASAAIIFPTEKLPIFFMEYDYAANAQTTKVPGDLFGGSLLVRAASANQGAVRNQRVTSGATLTSQWTAAAPGTTLVFDGASVYAGASDPANLKSFDAADDVTLEAWVRPNRIGDKARVIQHQTNNSNYSLGLQRKDLRSALDFDGVDDYIDLGPGITVGAPFTQEVWIYPAPDDDGFHGIMGHHPGATPRRAPSLWIVEKNKIHAGFGDGANWNSFITAPVLIFNEWNHVAAVFDGTWYRVYVNGVLKHETNAFQGRQPFNTPIKHIGKVDKFFKGRIDDARVWKRARQPQEILADMNRQLSGNETDLVGYWHFENGAAKDYSRNQNDGTLHGQPAQAVSPLPAYSIFAGVNGKFVQAREIFSGGNWTHLTAAYEQAFGLQFDGASGYLDGGKDDTLNINTDLTIEAFLQVDDLSQDRGILTRGKIDDGTEQNVPYALALDRSGHLVFAFEDTDGENYSFTSSAALTPGTPHRVAVTRKRQTLSYTEESFEEDNRTYTFAWDDIKIYLDARNPETFKYAYDDKVKQAIEEAQKANPSDTEINRLVGSYSASNLKPADIGRSNQALEIGRAYSTGFFKGMISEVRIWNASREAAAIGKELTTKVEGLVSWWRFEEREGNKAADSAGQNHATINGNVKWAKDPDLARSRLVLYCNDSEALLTDALNATSFTSAGNQFSLGALGNAPAQEFFQGELEEARIWKTARTPEQIQDSLFRRLTGEPDELIAYYTFDAEPQNKLTDRSPRGNHLTVQGAANYILSTAPIGEDAPQVRSALAGVRTPFSGLIHSRPGLHEYGDVQYDNRSNLIGVFKRCYGFVKGDDWQLITGFKIGDLATEWIGQVQFAPQLIGYIEGAPPVPSENLTQPSVELIGDLDDYNEASVIALEEAQETTHAYAASKEQGFGLEVEAALKFGFKSKSEAGLGFITSVEESKVLFGLRARFEAMWSWMEEANAGVTRATGKTTSLELRGRYTTPEETTPEREPFGRRFVPDNVGLALVQSETADVFALRLRHNNALISFQMRPNPDIPKDWNLISFPINPRYVKQGTLDGKMGPLPDVDYPNALTYSNDSSYFKPVEAYALKNRIQRETTELETYFTQFAAADKGRLAYFPSESALELTEASALKEKLRRNLVNSYVWTVDGGFFAETQQTMDVQTTTYGGSYEFKGMGGIDLAIAFAIAKVAAVFELNAMFVGQHQLNVRKSEESKTAFQMSLNLDKVERDIYKRDPNDRRVVLIDNSDPKRPRPIKSPYKVDAYRFMTFYLEPDSDHFDLFFNRVVDPIWLAQSDDPAAVALREARDEGKKPACWRIMHRVTYVSRVLPPLDNSAPPSLEKTLQTLDIDSNYELIKQLEPYVSNKLTSFADFADAVRETIKENLPELQPHEEEVIKYMSLYFGIADGRMPATEDDRFGESSLFELAPNQPPIVNAGLDQIIGLDGASTFADLDASVIDDRLQKAEAIFVAWEKISGEGNVTFDDPHAMKTKATFTKRGRYVLRLTASDGLLAASDDLIIIVNERPVISAGPDQQVNALQALLTGQIIDSGLGDPQTGTLTVTWSKQSRTGETNFDNKNALATAATFTTRGHYLLKLAVSNGTFDADDEVMIAVAARSTDQLQALYTFEENNGAVVHDVAGAGEPLDLVINDLAAVQWVTGGLAVNAPALLTTTGPATRLVEAVKSSNEITIEAWIKPASLNDNEGLARIATLADGSGGRNFILGQRNSGFHAGLRTTTTNANASNKVLAGGEVNSNQLSHLACTREASGLTRLYLNGKEVSRRMVEGNFTMWNTDFVLALGNEPGLNADQSWRGNFQLVAIYSRALSPNEVKQNFDFGADANLPPIVSAGPDKIIDWQDIQLSKITTTLGGRVTHDRPTPTTIINWAQVGGPGSPNGVAFENANSPSTKIEFNQKGRYVLRLTADDGESLMSDEAVIIVNRPPQARVNNGAAPKIALTEQTAVLELAGELLDSGLGDENAANSMSYNWSRMSGPATLQIENPQQLQTKARFTQRGVYGLKLEASNGRLSTVVPVTVTVNQKPVVNAGSNQIVTLPTEGTTPNVQATLTGVVTDTGLGNPQDTLLIKWEKTSGPEGAMVDFADATQLQTTATFTVGGVYVLRLTATNRDNPELTASAEVTITANELPIVDAGPDLQIALSDFAVLDGMVSDDGLPNPPGTVTTKWTKVSGPGSAIFADDTAVFTSVRFAQSGDYVLRLTAKDYASAIPVSDEMALKVLPSPHARVLEGLQVLYLFDEGTGDTVHDVSGVGAPIDLRMQPIDGNAQPLQWLGKGLRLIKPTILKSNAAATRLINALKASNALTIEAWVKRAASIPINRSPGRIVTLSGDIVHRNFTLGQLFEDRWQVRLRTTETDEDGVRLNNGRPAYQDIDLAPDLCHVAYTRDTAGKIRFYLNGADPAPSTRPEITGDFSNWAAFELALANELSHDRPWLGEYYLIAIYNRALSEAEVQKNFSAKF